MEKPKENDRWNAEYYKQHSAIQFNGALDILNNILFEGNEDIIDIGCGDGKITAEIANYLPNGTVLGIDASENMIQVCKQYYGHIKNLSFQCISADNFVISMKFDIVVSFFTFHWIENQYKALNNIYQMLKQGGVLIIKTSSGNCPEIAEVFERESWGKQIPLGQNMWYGKTADEYEQILIKCGFKNIKIETIQASRFFNTTVDFVNYAMGWVPHVTGLSNNKAIAFAHDLAVNVRAKMKRKDLQNRIELISPIVVIRTQKS